MNHPKCEKCGRFVSIKKPYKSERIYEHLQPLTDLFWHLKCYPKTINMKTYTREQVAELIDKILQHADCVMDAITNEHTDYDGEALLDIVDPEHVDNSLKKYSRQ